MNTSTATYGGHTEASRDNDVVSLQCIPMLVAFWCSERVETSRYGTHEILAAGYGRSTYAFLPLLYSTTTPAPSLSPRFSTVARIFYLSFFFTPCLYFILSLSRLSM